jgi:hypothetical protein
MTTKKTATNVASEKQAESTNVVTMPQVTNPTTTTDKEESELRKLRSIMVGYYARTAWEVFAKYADINETELSEFKRITEDATIVFTIPSEETLKANPERFKVGRKFGSVQWYKKTQVVENALNILTSWSSFVRYMDSKENQAKRDDKLIERTAALYGMSVKDFKAFMETMKK